ncbi:MAG: homospermidine synthase [Nannocystaceae bacterium]|nr:homospermidine synthase [Nannocystaceae bacterium]
MSAQTRRRSLLVGHRGGVGSAVMALLARGPARFEPLRRRELLLLDAVEGDAPALGTALPSQQLDSREQLAALVQTHAIDELVDVAGLDWCDALAAMAGRSYLCTSLERWHGPPRIDLLADARALVETPPAIAGAHVLGAGMNPGCVNALVDHAMAELAARVGMAPTAAALALYAVLVTEHDETRAEPDPAHDDADGCAATWSPRSCAEELGVPRTQWIDRGAVRWADHAPWQAEYRARCGDELIAGYVVPHDELVTLGARLPGVELAYVYRPAAATRRWLARGARPGRAGRLWPPHVAGTVGRDRVGVLLCSRRFGELWCGFETDCADAAAWGTNATLLQVAAGVLAGWLQLDEIEGVRTVEALDTVRYVDDVAAVLGAVRCVHDPSAAPAPLPSRRA